MEAAAARAARPSGRVARSRQRHRDKLGSVSARIMAPRIVLYVATFVLTAFGLLMIYSASSILCLTSAEYDNNPAYMVIRQAIFGGVGVAVAFALAHVDYRFWRGLPLKVAWCLSLGLLLLVYTPLAHGAYGATRWIQVAGFTVQPSELAKVTVLLTAANLCERHYRDGEYTTLGFAGALGVGVGIPLLFILFQPDKGTTGVLVLTVVIMLSLSGMPKKYLFGILAVGVVAALFLALKDDYSRARVMTMIDPFDDPYGDGYQLVQGFYAFGTGGLFGVGLGLSRQKYSYLPMAYNDFIFAVVGEELGLVGTLGTLAVFGLLVWAGLKIAENAPDLTGRLIAAGCTSLIAIQLLLNVCGVLGLFPLSGKPVPFISYGGTSLISSLMLVGLIASVSRHSTLPTTEADRRRSTLRVVGDEDERPRYRDRGTPRQDGAVRARPTPRVREEARTTAREAPRSTGSLRLVEGGRSARPASRGYDRVRLDDDPGGRLWSDGEGTRGTTHTTRRRR